MKKQSWRLPFKTITAITTWTALVLQLYLMINNTPGNGLTPWTALARFLIFFTVLCNLLVAVSLSVQLLFPRSAAGRFFANPPVEAAVAFYIVVVGLTYNTILRGIIHPTGLDRVADELLHVVTPVLFTLYWVLFVPKGFLKWKHPVQWLWFPGTYLAYALIRGANEGFYPYPFINVSELGYQKVMTNCAGLMIVFLLIGFLFVGIDRMITHQLKK